MSRNILSIDVGTSTVKAMVFADDGEPCAESRQATPLMAVAAGRAEADMDAIWQAVQEVVRNLPAAYRAEVAGVSLSGISCGAWLVDGTLRPVRSAILWNDGRAAGLIADWQADGRLEEIFRISGNVMFPGYTVPLLRWMKDNEPDQLRRAAHVLCCKDWVRLCMTGRVATDPSDASYMPWDLARRAFSPRLLELCGVADLVHLFPPAIESEALAGLLLPAAAEALGVSAGIAVATGLVDVAASSLGAGVVEPGQACTILGTSCLNSIVTDRCPLDGPAVGIASATVQGRWLRSQVNTAGTMNLDWLIREFWRDTPAAEVHAAVERAAASVPVGARGVLFHPYLNTAGVLSPFVHPHARAQLFGLSVEHGRDEVARAVLEGVALAIRDCYAAGSQTPTEVRLVGGGSRSHLWCQMIADCLGVPVLVPAVEPGCLGAAIVGAEAAGIGLGIAVAVARIGASRKYLPERSRAAAYDELFALYRAIATQSLSHWTARAAFLSRYPA